MIRSVRVSGFQSLHSVDLQLGRLTVVVGASSSGKSALVRALRVLASNSRGASYVTHGRKIASVSADGETDGLPWSVAIERGEGHGSYTVVRGGAERRFTKLGGAVPSEVTDVLRIQPGGELNFAGQFDRPYLLDSTGSEVARALGKLTNVTMVLEASREANRRRQGVASSLKTRQADLQRLTEELQQFVGLVGRLSAQDEAEAALLRATTLESRRDRLASLLSDLCVATAFMSTVQSSASEPPSLERVQAVRDRLGRFQALLRELAGGRVDLARSSAEAASVGSELEALEAERVQLLHEAGQCPTCGQSTSDLVSV